MSSVNISFGISQYYKIKVMNTRTKFVDLEIQISHKMTKTTVNYVQTELHRMYYVALFVIPSEPTIWRRSGAT